MKHVKCFKEGYPRPQFVKDHFMVLDGTWHFCFDDDNVGEAERWYDCFPCGKNINVPYSYHTTESGINDKSEHNYIWYAKNVKFDEDLTNKRLLLNFEGCDYICKVWVNGTFVGMHKGGYALVKQK